MDVRFNPSYRFVICGAKGVGKTTIQNQISAQIETFKGDVSMIEQPESVLHLSGQDGSLLVFSITDQKSFESLAIYLKKIKTHIAGPIILIGNKADNVVAREVDYMKVVKFAETNGLHYEEISGNNPSDIEKVFKMLIDEILRSRLINDICTAMSGVGPSRFAMRTTLLTKCQEIKSLDASIAALAECGANAQKDHEDRSGSRWFAFGPLFKPESTTKKITDDLITKYKFTN